MVGAPERGGTVLWPLLGRSAIRSWPGLRANGKNGNGFLAIPVPVPNPFPFQVGPSLGLASADSPFGLALFSDMIDGHTPLYAGHLALVPGHSATRDIAFVVGAR